MKKAFITGITGQDGSYLSELLLDKGYEVHGLVRRSSNFVTCKDSGIIYENGIGNLKNHDRLHLHYGDLSDFSSISRCLEEIRPDEIYNLGAMSDVRISFDTAEYTANISGLGALRVVEALRNTNLKKTKFYQASSSEMFGKVQEVPQKETTPFYPRSPYAVSKVFAHWICKNYRESYGMFISTGILFNHESPRRGLNFVTRKITQGIGRILIGKQEKIYLGNLDAKRDWGYAPEYVEAMWLMLQREKPDDYVIATGESHTVREFLEEAFGHVGLKWGKYVEIKKYLFRPAETDILLGDMSKARKELNWKPKVSFKELVKILLDADIAATKTESLQKKHE
ncbi:MAG: GDP-D-mannose dehydratase [Parcubacteria group bacterium GW2011_GWA2_47_12]|nr:MAG: GDP-D-mannose dehydratase [Parcubacteria group bacterium GW2011_GWA2_47_12]